MPRPPLLVLLAFAAGGCIPYTVGSTAAIAPRGVLSPSASLAFVPVAPEDPNEDPNGDPDGEPIDEGAFGPSYSIVDPQARFGLDARSDVGIRAPGLVGFVVDYKRRMLGGDSLGPGLALMAGAGVLNAGQHAHLEATLLASGAEDGMLVPFGGLRAMQTFPIVRGAASDRPTLGAFVGVRIGRADLGVSPEVGLFYDPSALGLRDSDFVVVPAITVHGVELVRALFSVLSP